MKNELVSIIMPTYNRGYIIERAIDSVIAQTYQNWELIIVDDASNDNTKQVLSKYSDLRIRCYVNEHNKGANESRNIGASYAQGEFLAFLDSDNYWPNNKLELQMDVYQKYSESRIFLYGKVQIKEGNVIQEFPEEAISGEALKLLELNKNIVDTNTIFMKKALFTEIGGFENSLPRLQDWELVLRMLYLFDVKGICCEACVSYNEIQEDSIGKDDFKLVKAIGFLYKKYMCKYLSEEKMLECLSWLLSENRVPRDMLDKIIAEVIIEKPGLMSLALEQLHATALSYCKSSQMEKILYAWHNKNLQSKKTTFLYDYIGSDKTIKKIAFYGVGNLGRLFYEEVKTIPIEIAYAIDRSQISLPELRIRKPEEILEPVDLVVVTLVKGYSEICDMLKEKNIGKVVSLVSLLLDEGGVLND